MSEPVNAGGIAALVRLWRGESGSEPAESEPSRPMYDNDNQRHDGFGVQHSEQPAATGARRERPEGVAWCPACKRYVRADNEASHVRRKHVSFTSDAIRSDYRRVPRAVVGGEAA